MLDSITIRTKDEMSLIEFFDEQDFDVEKLTETVLKVTRQGELPVFLQFDSDNLFFEVDLGNVSSFATQDFYFRCLDLNTEILPVSVGIDQTNPDDPRLVLVESRETTNLDKNEILSVFNALELATDKIEAVLADFIK